MITSPYLSLKNAVICTKVYTYNRYLYVTGKNISNNQFYMKKVQINMTLAKFLLNYFQIQCNTDHSVIILNIDATVKYLLLYTGFFIRWRFCLLVILLAVFLPMSLRPYLNRFQAFLQTVSYSANTEANITLMMKFVFDRHLINRTRSKECMGCLNYL